MSLMASFCAVLFPRDVLDECWDLIESVSEGFPTYSWFSFVKENLDSTLRKYLKLLFVSKDIRSGMCVISPSLSQIWDVRASLSL